MYSHQNRVSVTQPIASLASRRELIHTTGNRVSSAHVRSEAGKPQSRPDIRPEHLVAAESERATIFAGIEVTTTVVLKTEPA